MLLVGNKCDLKESREVTFSEGKNLADDLGCKFYETSAKENINNSIIFEECVSQYKLKIKNNEHLSLPGLFTSNDDNNNKSKRKRCIIL